MSYIFSPQTSLSCLWQATSTIRSNMHVIFHDLDDPRAPDDVKEVVDSEIKYVRPTPPPGSLLTASLYVMYREWHFREAQLSPLLLVQCR